MAPPSKISQLPPEVRDELNKRIIANQFSDYDGLEAWLSERLEACGLSVQISRSAIHREGRKLERIGERVKAMQMMQAGWQAQMGNRGIGELGRVLNAQLQGLAFALTQDAADGKIEMDAEFLRDMSSSIMRLEKAAAINEDRDQSIRADERQRADEKIKALEKESGKPGKTTLDAATLKMVREQVYGIVG